MLSYAAPLIDRFISLLYYCLGTRDIRWPTAPEHALHVLEIITAARASHKTGRRVELTSSFNWPIIA
jgi:hypothetical protein